MNQIIYLSTKSPLKKAYKYLFIFSILIIIICISIFFILQKNSYENEKVSKTYISNYNLNKLYLNKNENSISNIIEENSNNPFIIGILEIKKINITYPIISKTSDELLKIAPCRFSGPNPNQIGNLCIAGHNYANSTIFGKLKLLNVGDVFTIFDLSRQ